MYWGLSVYKYPINGDPGGFNLMSVRFKGTFVLILDTKCMYKCTHV